MKIVKENLNFERGINPKKSLELGEYRKILAPVDWKSLSSGIYKIFNNNYSKGIESAYIEIKEHGMYYMSEWGNIGDSVSLLPNTVFNPQQILYSYIQKVDKIREIYK